MKKSELKQIIREILSEQMGPGPNPGQTMGQPSGGTPRPPISQGPNPGQTMSTGGNTGGSGITSSQVSQMMALVQQGEKEYQSKRIPKPAWLRELIRLILSSGTIQA